MAKPFIQKIQKIANWLQEDYPNDLDTRYNGVVELAALVAKNYKKDLTTEEATELEKILWG
jgi:hypothetical protein